MGVREVDGKDMALSVMMESGKKVRAS